MLRLDDLASTQKNFPLMENATSSSCVLPADAASERITLEQAKLLRPAPPDSDSKSAEPDAPQKFQPLPAQEMPDSLILRKLIDDILRIDHNGCKVPFYPTSERFPKVWQTNSWKYPLGYETKRAVTLHMCPNKLQEIHHYRVAKSFACFPCHPLNGNRRKFFGTTC